MKPRRWHSLLGLLVVVVAVGLVVHWAITRGDNDPARPGKGYTATTVCEAQIMGHLTNVTGAVFNPDVTIVDTPGGGVRVTGTAWDSTMDPSGTFHGSVQRHYSCLMAKDTEAGTDIWVTDSYTLDAGTPSRSEG